jgi:hypothetical protein
MKRLLLSLCILLSLGFVVFWLTEPQAVNRGHGASSSWPELKLTEPQAGNLPASGSDFRKQAAKAIPRAKQRSITSSRELAGGPTQKQGAAKGSVSPEPDFQHWVEVLLPAKVHNGPSVETPITSFYPVGTPLRVNDYRQGWFEIFDPTTSKTGWIYQEYLGATNTPSQSEMAAKEQPTQAKAQPMQTTAAIQEAAPATRYKKSIPSSRAKDIDAGKRKASRPRRDDFASYIQRGFGGT